MLTNGPGGWIQTANFVITGAMVVATAVAFRRVLGPKSRGVTWFLGAFGVAMIVAAVFAAWATWRRRLRSLAACQC